MLADSIVDYLSQSWVTRDPAEAVQELQQSVGADSSSRYIALMRTALDLAEFYEGQPVMVIVLDARGYIRFVNDFACHEMGYQCGMLIGKNYRAVVHEDDMTPGEKRNGDLNMRASIAVASRRWLTGDGKYKSIFWLPTSWVSEHILAMGMVVDKD